MLFGENNEYGLMQDGFAIEDTVYTDQVEMKVLVPLEEKEQFTKRVTALSEGKITPAFEVEVLAAQHEGQWYYYDIPAAEEEE